MKKIGVIGLGQWGPNHVRSFFFHPGVELVRVCDKDQGRLKAIRATYPLVEAVRDSKMITQSPDIDAVVIATPVSTHFSLAKDALLNGKDVLCEKPLTLNSKESSALVALAKRKKRILMVGHVFMYNPGILKLKEILHSREWGQTYYLHAKRTNLGPVRKDANAVYDLASHDISIFNFLFDAQPRVISASGMCYLQRKVEDVAFISLQYPRGVVAHLHVSWLDPKKVREITVIGNREMVTWNDLRLNGPIEIYSKRVEQKYYKDYGEFHLLVKEGEVRTPYVRNMEPMRLQANHFVECINRRKQPLSDGRNGLAVVKTLEDIERVLKRSRKK